jgi:PAS domain S-box-containing protein
VLLADGRTFERYSAPFPHDGPRARLWSFRDVTDRVRAEEAARRNHRFFETVIDTALDGYWVAGPDGAIREVNDAVCEMLGYTRRELLGMRIRDIEAMESPADVEARFQRIRTTGRDRFETRHRRKDGRLIDVEMSLRRLDLEDCPVVGFSRDLTERKRMQERMALSARLAGMGTLVAGVAHEVNNPLAAVLSSDGFALECVRALSGQVEEGDAPTMENVGRTLRDVAEALEDAQSAGQRIAQIVRSMAALANPHPTLSRTRLADVVSAAVRWLPAFVEKAVDLEVDVDGAPTGLAAPGQLEQLVVNLVGNAARSVRRGRRGLVRIRAFLPVPGLARIEVTDDGVGIDPAILPRIFDPFFTTRPSGEGHGAGLGLAVSHAIAEAHGGTLGVESVPGMGATFRLDLPAVADGPDGTGPAAGDRAAEP